MKRHGQKCIHFPKKVASLLKRLLWRREAVFGVVMGLLFRYAAGVDVFWSVSLGILFYFALLTAQRRQRMVDEYKLEVRAQERMIDLLALLEVMMDEPAVQEAKSAYESMKKAADDPWDDTGWDEPWAAAIEAAFNYAIEEKDEIRSITIDPKQILSQTADASKLNLMNPPGSSCHCWKTGPLGEMFMPAPGQHADWCPAGKKGNSQYGPA